MIEKHRAHPYLMQFLLSIKLRVRRKLIGLKPLYLKEVFNSENFKSSDIYDPIVFRSTIKDRQHDSLNEHLDPIDEMCDLLEALLPKNKKGEFELSPEEFRNHLKDETKDWGADIFLMYHNLGYFHESHEYYSKNIDPKTIEKDELSEIRKEKEVEVIADRLLKHHSDPFSMGNLKYDISDDDKGYIVPVYNLLRWNLNHLEIERDYHDISKEISAEENFDLTAAASIGNYRDLLVKQLDRQNSQLEDLNGAFLDFMTVFYLKIEENIKSIWEDCESPESKTAILDDWQYIFGMMREMYDSFYLNNDDDEILRYHEKTISEIPYINEQQKDEFINQMYHIRSKKNPILNIARRLAQKAAICESLLEDLLIGEPVKTFKEFSDSLEVELTSDIIIDKVQFHYDNRMIWGDIFIKIRKWLFTEYGLDEDSVKKQYGFGISKQETFERHMKNKISLRSRNS